MSLIPGDKRAAFIGMVTTSLLLFLMAFTIVKLTNRKFERHKAEAEAGQTR